MSERSIAVHTPGQTPLADFLTTLPKPAAVMAAYDVRASEVISLCNNLNIDIPKQISVLGVDNDEILCNISTPTLSSISPTPSSGSTASQ